MPNIKIFLILLLVFLTIFSVSKKAEGNTVYEVYPGESIQETIDKAVEGSKIIIMPGEYLEQVVITKRISLIGFGNLTVLKNLGGGRTVTIPRGVNNVTIANFLVQGSKESTGIYVGGLNNVIENMTIENHRLGIFFWDSSGNVLRDNNIVNNTYNLKIWGLSLSHFLHDIDTTNLVNGKKIYYWINSHDRIVPNDAGFAAVINSTNVVIQNLNLSHNHLGVLLAYTNSSIIWNCSLTKNEEGIRLINSHNNAVVNNQIHTNEWIGISLVASTCNYLTGNKFTNGSYGIYFSYSSLLPALCSKNNVAGNTIEFNRHGIYLDNAFNNEIYANVIAKNTYGVTIENSWDNIFHRNVLENEYNAYLYSSDTNTPINTWNSEYPIGGNYWSDYTGIDNFTGPYQNETGIDGIGDNPFLVYKNNYDYYPLINRPENGQQFPLNFTFTPEEPKVGDLVQFIDLSSIGSLNLRLWMFSDGAIYEFHNFSRSFDNAGEYSVVLFIVDLDGKVSWVREDFFVRKLRTTITISAPVICSVGEQIIFRAQLIDENSYPLYDSKIHFYFLHAVKKEWIGVSCTDEKGIGELSFSFTNQGCYIIEAVFEGTSKYENSMSKCFVISKTSSSSLLIVPDDYSSIQEALDNASNGDIIFVRNGIYKESVVLNKTIIICGENWETTVIETDRHIDAIRINASGAKVSNFLIRNVGNSPLSCGIRIVGGINNKVSDNLIEGKFVGIMLENGSIGNVIQHNVLRKNRYGIFIKRLSNKNTIRYNIIMKSGWNGIELAWCRENIIKANTIMESGGYGIEIPFYSPAYDNQIFHNNFLNNSLGQASDFASNSWTFNYWNNYNGQDADNDGIGDVPYLINVNVDETVLDPLPLMGQYAEFLLNGLELSVISNLAVVHAYFDFHDLNGVILLQTEASLKRGFCRVAIPKTLLDGCYEVTVNQGEASSIIKEITLMDEDYRILYIECPANIYLISISGVTLIPEIVGIREFLVLLFSLLVLVLKFKQIQKAKP